MTKGPKIFLFAQPSGTKKWRHFKLAVHARNLRAARTYVRTSNAAYYRTLKYIGEGPPSNPEDWTAAIVRD